MIGNASTLLPMQRRVFLGWNGTRIKPLSMRLLDTTSGFVNVNERKMTSFSLKYLFWARSASNL